jgi:CHASE3 domain sensor protein
MTQADAKPPDLGHGISRLYRIVSTHVIGIAFVACAAGVLGFGSAALYLLQRAQYGDAQVLHTAVAIAKLEALHLVLVEAESAGRAFLIAGSERSRTRYN